MAKQRQETASPLNLNEQSITEIQALHPGHQLTSTETSPQSELQRRNSAYQIRRQAALAEHNLGPFHHLSNGDEERYANRIGNFSKTMRHNAIGEVEPADYARLLQALRSGNFHDFEAIPKGGTA